MPRQPRLDAPETLHHVMVRGIERTVLFRDEADRADFVGRLARLAEQGALTVYAWALLPNHAHLLVRSASRPLARSMRRLLTGYAGAFNRRHQRTGLLFQNRYKSIVVEAEPYHHFAVNIETKDDLSYDGIVLRENNNVVVLRNQNAETEIRKNNIASRRRTDRSLMPEGFEQLGADGLRDLLTLLCADVLRFRILDLSEAFTADTSRGIYMTAESRDESLRFKKWGTIKHRDVPFDIVNPVRTATGRNVIVLQGGSGMSRNYPRQVEVKVGLPATKLYFLGGVAGWGHPLGRENEPVVKVTADFAGGDTEEIVLRNGVEFADYIGRFDVPGSEALANLDMFNFFPEQRIYTLHLSQSQLG